MSPCRLPRIARHLRATCLVFFYCSPSACSDRAATGDRGRRELAADGCLAKLERSSISVRGWPAVRKRKTPRPEPPGRNDVGLGRQQRDLNGQVDEREQPDHAREGSVGVRGGSDDVVDIEASARQEQLPGKSRKHRAAAELAPRHLVGGQQAESEPKERDVRRG